MVATAVTAEKECDAKRSLRRQSGGEAVVQIGEVGRRDTEGQGVFFEYEKVGFQGVANKRNATLEDCSSELVQRTATGVVVGYDLFRFKQGLMIKRLLLLLVRIESEPEQFDQLQGDVRMRVERARYALKVETGLIVVGEVGMTEGDEGVGQGRLFSGHDAIGYELAIRLGFGAQNLCVVEFFLKRAELLRVRLKELVVAGAHVKCRQEVGIYTGVDCQAVGASYLQAEPLQDFQGLLEEILLRWVGNSKEQSRFTLLIVTLGFFRGQEDAAVNIALLKEPEDLSDSFGRRNAHIIFVVDPDHAQGFVKIIKVVFWIVVTQLRRDFLADSFGNSNFPCVKDFLGAFSVKFEALDFEAVFGSWHRTEGTSKVGIGDFFLLQILHRLVERARM